MPTLRLDGRPEDLTTSAPAAPPDRYSLGGRIGRGGMGEVMAARDEQIGRDVAIKRMHATTPGADAWFLREATIQGRLEHPAIVPVHEVGCDAAGRPYFVMKLVSGTTLAEVIRARDATPIHRVLRGFADACIAVAFAHSRGIVHRDLKPDNIMFGEFGEVYVLDWGVAKVVGEPEPGAVGGEAAPPPGAATAGLVIGTPGYMAPEQRRGAAELDGRADVYALGRILSEILTGEPCDPAADAPRAPAEASPSGRGPEREIPPELAALCRAATAEAPAARPSARELSDRVLHYLDGDRDLALRQALARDHLTAAELAFAAEPSDASRAVAMREAAAAMALDPRLDGPGELITRMMLDPPRHTPRDVVDAIRRDDARTAHFHTKASLIAITAGLALVPFQWWMAPRGSPHIVVYTLLLAVGALAFLWLAHRERPWPGLVVVGNAAIVLVVAAMYSPLLIAPGLGAVLAMASVAIPRYSVIGSAVTVAALMIAVTLGPLALELTGVLPSTVEVGPGGIVFHAPAVGDAHAPSVAAAGLYTAALIIGATMTAEMMRRRTREAHHRLHLQAWQLRQLVAR